MTADTHTYAHSVSHTHTHTHYTTLNTCRPHYQWWRLGRFRPVAVRGKNDRLLWNEKSACTENEEERGSLYIYIYISLYCHHQDDSCVKMGSEESHNVSLIVKDKVTRQCPQTDTSFEHGKESRCDGRGSSAYRPGARPTARPNRLTHFIMDPYPWCYESVTGGRKRIAKIFVLYPITCSHGVSIMAIYWLEISRQCSDLDPTFRHTRSSTCSHDVMPPCACVS